MLKKLLLPLTILIFQTALAQYNPSIDVQHYEFRIKLSDANDSITGHAFISVHFTEATNKVQFDLMNINDTGRGMMVTAVKEKNKDLAFTHRNNLINISLNDETYTGEGRVFEIFYKGIPADGLIFSKNKYNHRTIFGDNWPNRARHWIPCKDHLSDKASVEFVVTAPSHYQVVSNGVKVEDRDLVFEHNMHLTVWSEEALLSTKIMVIGVADFAVDKAGTVDGIPVSSWVFPEVKEKGFHDYGQAVDILPFFIKNVGPYSYKKLANVQSKTIFGGMENAGAIFYAESSITGTRKSEELLAHEIAHQWFGDAASETDWPHIWLSEGFATEMTNLYLEHKYGRDTVVKRLQTDRNEALAFTKRKKLPVVDTSESKNLMQLLNTNSYEKGGWVLHMLRNTVGDDLFWKSIQTYYTAYRGKNASTRDLQKIFETVSGKDLETFFTQWLYTPENPTLDISWKYNEGTNKLLVTVEQQNNKLFSFPLDIELTNADGSKEIKTVTVSDKLMEFNLAVKSKTSKVSLDPNCKLLFEGTVKEK